MHFIELKEQLRGFLVFSLKDIKKIDPNFYRARLNEWQNKGYLKKITKGHYIFSDLEINESVLFVIANKIYAPSYISFEMALSYYNLIPESVYGITSASSRKTNSLSTPIGEFIYRKIKSELLFGYKLIDYLGHNYTIAEIEKALLDYFYANAHLKSKNDFFEMRFNLDELTSQLDKEKLKSYLAAFNNKSLEKRVNNFLKFAYAVN